MAAGPILQPGEVGFDLDLAGLWARGALRRLPTARLAGPSIGSEHWDEASEAMSALLSTHLALKHAYRIVSGAPWLDTRPPLDLDEISLLLRHTELFRDALMHFEDKATRSKPKVVPIPRSPLTPGGYVAMSFGFDEYGATLFAQVKKRGPADWIRVSWDEMERAARAIEAWALDVQARWDDVQKRWAPYVEALTV